ncbi:MAG: hypothetical protein NVSMB1_02020 [Polyangiales bacterium]
MVTGLVAGCSGGCRKGTPYVPFLVEAGPSAIRDSEVVTLDSATEGSPAPSFQSLRASLAPPSSSKWSIEGLAFEAPAGQLIVAALAHDLDGDGQRDVAAYVQPGGGGGGELRFYRGDDKGSLAPGPGKIVGSSSGGADIALPAPCAGKPTMTLAGPHTITLDLHPACGDAAPSPRRFAVAAFVPTPSIRFNARVTDPPAGWTFNIDVDALDRDGDGVDDPAFVFSLEGGGPPYEPGERVAAKLRYWDRPAGLSRDRTEPEVSFQSIAQLAAGRSMKRSSAPLVAPLVRRLRLLHAALCSEGGAPWLEIGGDRGIKCGPSRGLEEAGLAEIRADLALSDVLSASAARERMSIPSTAKTKKIREEIDRSILGAGPSLWGITRDVRAIPSTPSKGAPAFGALTFEKSGGLLVRTSTGVTRIDANMEESEANDVPGWSWEVAFPGKDVHLSAVVDACDAPFLAARVAGHDVPTGAMLLPLPMMPSMSPARCPEGRSATFLVNPVSWGPTGLFALVDHEPVLVPTELATASGARATGTAPAPGSGVEGPFTPGSPRSPSLAFLVVPTRFGIVRRNDATSSNAFIRAKELEGLYGSLRECAIADSGMRLACIREGKAVVLDVSAVSASPSASASVAP